MNDISIFPLVFEIVCGTYPERLTWLTCILVTVATQMNSVVIIVKALNFKNVSLKACVKANLSARSRNTWEKIKKGWGASFVRI